MNPFLLGVLVLFVLAYLAITLVVLRRPLIGRIAIREAIRRPGQTVVLIVGLMIAGAAIFAVQVVVDSHYETNRAEVAQSWGRDDVEISAGGSSFDPALTQQLASATQSCSCIAAFQNAAITNGSVVDLRREAGRPNVQITGLDLSAQHSFGVFVLTNGGRTYGDELSNGGVFITQPLASALGAADGDELRVIAGRGASHNVIVAGVVDRAGAGAYGFDLSMFGSLPTVQQLAGIDGVNLIRVSARGDGDAEVASGHTAAHMLTQAIVAAGQNLRVLEAKSSALDIVVKMSQNGRPFNTAFAVIIALAATALVANLAIMLAEERRPRLAVLRALGLTRTGLVQLSVTEGAFYSLLGAIVGLPAGIAFALIIVLGSPPADSTANTSSLVPIAALAQPLFSVHFESLLGSVAAAAMMNLTTVFIASLRTNQMAISSAIRDLPEPAVSKRRSWKRTATLSVFVVAGAVAVFSGHIDYAILGGGLIIAAAAGFLRGRLPDRWRYSVAALTATVWAFIEFLRGNVSAGGPTVLAYAVLVSVLGLSVLVATNLTLVDSAIGLLGHVSGRLRATLRPAMAYSSRRPLRAGLAIAAFAIVLSILVLIESLVAVESHNYAIDSGGWDVQALVAGTDQLSVPSSVQAEVRQQEVLPARTFVGPVDLEFNGFEGNTGWHHEAVTFFGLTSEQLDSGMGFGDPKVWARIARDPSLIAAPAPVGSKVLLATDRGTTTFTVIATIPSTGGSGTSLVVPGAIASKQALNQLNASAAGAMMLLKAAPGISPDELSRNLQQALLDSGVIVTTTKSLMDQDFAAGVGQVDFLILLLRVGLLVGVSSLGAVALRAVIERRRSIGMLRAIGYQPRQILVGMLIETAVVATAGMAVGLIIGYALGGPTIEALSADASFNPDPFGLAVTVGLVYAAVLLVTFLPALQASRLRPAEALRVMS